MSPNYMYMRMCVSVMYLWRAVVTYWVDTADFNIPICILFLIISWMVFYMIELLKMLISPRKREFSSKIFRKTLPKIFISWRGTGDHPDRSGDFSTNDFCLPIYQLKCYSLTLCFCHFRGICIYIDFLKKWRPLKGTPCHQ